MKKTFVIETDEHEILDLINKHFGIAEDSIVAVEELGNEVWVVDVSPHPFELDDFIVKYKMSIKKYYFREALARLCYDGVIEEGTYNIDCTW